MANVTGVGRYKRLSMRGDVARILPERFIQPYPKDRTEALERVNRWNRLVAEEAIQAGLSNAEVFYYLDAEGE